MAITVRKLEVFLEVAEHASFRAAADQLGISQPSVSTQIAQLEAEIGFALFHRRSGAKPELTERGHEFIAKAREIVSSHADLAGSQPAPTVERKKLVIAAGAAFLELLGPDLQGLILEHPEVDIEFEAVTQLHSMLRGIDERLIDLALYTGPLPPQANCRVEIICPVSYSIFACPELAARHAGDSDEEEPLPLILPPRGGWATEPIRAMLAKAGVSTRNVVARSPFPGFLLEMALSGVAAIIAPEDVMTGPVSEGRLVAVRSNIGKGYRYMLIGPKARCAQSGRIVEHLKEIVLARHAAPAMIPPARPSQARVFGKVAGVGAAQLASAAAQLASPRPSGRRKPGPNGSIEGAQPHILAATAVFPSWSEVRPPA